MRAFQPLTIEPMGRYTRVVQQRASAVESITTPTADKSAPFLATSMVLLLGVAVPLIVTGVTPDPTSRGEDFGVLTISIFGGLMLAMIMGSRQRRPYEMVFWVFFYVFMGIAPMVQIRMAIDPGTTLGIQHSLIGEAAQIVIIGGLAFVIGTWMSTLLPAKHREKASKVVSRAASANRAYILSVASLGIFAFYALKLGPANLFLSRAELSVLREAVWPDKSMNAMIGAGASMGLLVSMIALIHLRQRQKREGRHRAFFMPAIVLMALLICINPISTPRYVFGTALLALFAAVGLYATVRRVRVLAISFVSGLVFVFPGLDAFRNSVSGDTQNTDTLTSLTTGDFDAFAQIVNTVEYVEIQGITWGNQLMGVVFFWVPRSIWQEKAVDTGTLLANMKGYWFTNLSAPLWSEFFINGGWLALIVGMFALGFAIRRWDRALNLSVSMGVPASILGCIMPFYLLILLRGSLLQAVAFMSVILACAFFVRPRDGGSERLPAPAPSSAPDRRPVASQDVEARPVDGKPLAAQRAVQDSTTG